MSRHVFILSVCLAFAAVLALDRMDAMRKTLDRIADNLQGLAVIKIGQLCQEPEPFHYVPPPAIEHLTYRIEVLDGTNIVWREGMEAVR